MTSKLPYIISPTENILDAENAHHAIANSDCRQTCGQGERERERERKREGDVPAEHNLAHVT